MEMEQRGKREYDDELLAGQSEMQWTMLQTAIRQAKDHQNLQDLIGMFGGVNDLVDF